MAAVLCVPQGSLHGQDSVLGPSNPLLFRSFSCPGGTVGCIAPACEGGDYSPRQHKASSLLQGGREMSDASKALAALFLTSWNSSAHPELTSLIFPEEVLVSRHTHTPKNCNGYFP